MQNYQKINNISGWLIFAVSTIVYWITVEPTASYWDCGEFIAVSYKLEVPHPPGAPLYLLIGRLFSFLALGDVEKVAYWINISSVIASGFTILFLFWTITLLGRKIFNIEKGKETTGQTFLLMGGAAVGALAYTFSDSFWFSAVEAEVYAMSSFFTAFVFWAILKWEVIEDESLANKWLVLISYMMGLSIGVHLLNLVTIPALGLIYYFKKYKVSRNGLIASFAVSGFVVVLVNNIIIPGFPSIGGSLEVFFVNNLGMPFGTGIIFFGIILIGALVYGVYYSYVKEKVLLNTALLGLTFILIGYSSYTSLVIRSKYNPPIDENNPENVMSFVSYLKREQYGSRPLLHGQYFDAKLVDQVLGAKVYVKGKDKYEISDAKIEYKYDPERTTILPRAYSSDAKHVELYREYMGLKENEVPDFIDNIQFMFNYQLGHMYVRYFLWNFASRESDIQHAGWFFPWEDHADIPEEFAQNKARNNFYFIPLILGIIGMFFHYNKNKKDFYVLLLLYFLTGIALVLYLNSPPVEPRERDYIYVGSYYVFAMWIGIGVMALGKLLSDKLGNAAQAAVITTVVCLAVPSIMAIEGWDDHDRSNRYFSVDSARNFLASCAPNAILFTGGDNDTFPLWYIQEVEGYRTDVRVIVLSYFNTDWYIDQMTRPAYESQPLPFSLTFEQYKQGGANDYLPYYENQSIKGAAINLNQYLKLIKDEHPGLQVPTKFGKYNSVPSKSLFLNIDTTNIKNRNIVPEDKFPYITDRMVFNLRKGGLEKNTLMILDLIANNNWERPIYFNNTSLQGVSVNLNDYVVQEGNAYRLLPVKNPDPRSEFVNSGVMYENVMNEFRFRGLDDPKVYNSIDHRNFALNHRSTFNSLANALIKEGKIEQAKEVLNKCLEAIPDISIPYDYTSSQTVKLLYSVGENEKAKGIAEVIGERANEALNYFDEYNIAIGNETQKNLLILNDLVNTMKTQKENELAQRFEEYFIAHYSKLSS
jgi:tetratricopeptide (TPR) repeat protein